MQRTAELRNASNARNATAPKKKFRISKKSLPNPGFGAKNPILEDAPRIWDPTFQVAHFTPRCEKFFEQVRSTDFALEVAIFSIFSQSLKNDSLAIVGFCSPKKNFVVRIENCATRASEIESRPNPSRKQKSDSCRFVRYRKCFWQRFFFVLVHVMNDKNSSNHYFSRKECLSFKKVSFTTGKVGSQIQSTTSAEDLSK